MIFWTGAQKALQSAVWSWWRRAQQKNIPILWADALSFANSKS